MMVSISGAANNAGISELDVNRADYGLDHWGARQTKLKRDVFGKVDSNQYVAERAGAFFCRGSRRRNGIQNKLYARPRFSVPRYPMSCQESAGLRVHAVPRRLCNKEPSLQYTPLF